MCFYYNKVLVNHKEDKPDSCIDTWLAIEAILLGEVNWTPL